MMLHRFSHAVLVLMLVCPVVAWAQTQTWTKRSSIPGAGRDAVLAFSIGSKVYLGGGIGLTTFYEYDTETGAWTRKADLPGVTKERAFGTGFAVAGKGYIGFGYDGSTNLKADLWEYDPTVDTWTRKADFPGEARDGVTSFVVDGKAYVGGGSNNQYLYGDFYEYDPAGNIWTRKADLPTGPAIFVASFAIGSYAYIATGAGTTELVDAYRYDAAHDEWMPIQEFPGTPRQCCVAFAVNGIGYVGFGQSSYTSVYNDFYSYNPVTDTWAVAGTFPSGKGRAWGVAVVANSRAFVGTGWDFGSNMYNDWWELTAGAAAAPGAPSQSMEVKAYPNPTMNAVRLDAPDARAIDEVGVMDALGRAVIVRSFVDAESSCTIDLSELAPGAYILRVTAAGAVSNIGLVKR